MQTKEYFPFLEKKFKIFSDGQDFLRQIIKKNPPDSVNSGNTLTFRNVQI